MFKLAMRSVLLGAVICLGIASVDTGADSGNGAFSTSFRGDEVGFDEKAWVQFEIYCNSGFTCGLASVEMDWDDGTFDSIVGNVSQCCSNPLEDEWIHQYASTGQYDGRFEVDDDLGNWQVHDIEFNVID
jgi:hypothetical protein